jgi:hypothetical protein
LFRRRELTLSLPFKHQQHRQGSAHALAIYCQFHIRNWREVDNHLTAYQGQIFNLGRKVVFTASDPAVEEWRRLFRVLYADGGMFAHGVTYFEFLNERLSPNSENECTAHLKEIAECGSGSTPRTQTEMRRLLDGDAAESAQSAIQQMDFAP